MPKRQSSIVTAPEAPEADATSAGVQTPEANNVADIQTPAPEAPTAVTLAAADVAEIESALDGAKAPALRSVLEAQLAEAIGALALAEADASLQAERQAAEAEALQAVQGISNDARRQAAYDAMMQAIEAQYAPLPEAEPEAPEAEAQSATRPISARTAERNARVAEAFGADFALRQRAIDTLAAWDTHDVATCLAQRQAGTRYASLVALAPHGAGVANAADYKILATAVRLYLLESLPANGNSVAESVWLARRGRSFAPTAPKGASAVQACFTTRAELALYADGRFRLAPASMQGVQFCRNDDAAWNLFIGASASLQLPLSAAPEQSGQLEMPLPAPKAPTAPGVQADASTGKLTPLAACQHCGTRNVVGYAECRSCQADDWNASA